MNIYKCYIYIQTESYTKEELEKLTDIYIQSKKIKNIFKSQLRIKKLKNETI